MLSEITELRDDLKEIKQDQKDMICKVSDLHILIAGDYAKKKDLSSTRSQIWTAILGSYAAIIAFLYYITTLINTQFAQHLDQFKHIAK